MNDDVREIVAQVLYQITSQYATVFELKVGATDETPGMEIDRHAADAILAALADKGRGLYDINAEVKVDRERFERQRNVTEAAYEWVNSPLGDGVEIERVEKRLVSLVDALQPGDLDPLPERGE